MIRTISEFTTTFKTQLEAGIPTHGRNPNSHKDAATILEILGGVFESENVKLVNATNFAKLQQLFCAQIDASVSGRRQSYSGSGARKISVPSKITPLSRDMVLLAKKAFS